MTRFQQTYERETARLSREEIPFMACLFKTGYLILRLDKPQKTRRDLTKHFDRIVAKLQMQYRVIDVIRNPKAGESLCTTTGN